MPKEERVSVNISGVPYEVVVGDSLRTQKVFVNLPACSLRNKKDSL